MNWIWLTVGIIVGVFLTVIVTMWCRFAGLIRIHPNDEEGGRPYLFLELDDAPEKLLNKKYVVFRVKMDSR